MNPNWDTVVRRHRCRALDESLQVGSGGNRKTRPVVMVTEFWGKVQEVATVASAEWHHYIYQCSQTEEMYWELINFWGGFRLAKSLRTSC